MKKKWTFASASLTCIEQFLDYHLYSPLLWSLVYKDCFQ